MRAVLRSRYCSPSGLSISEIPQPVPGENDLLIRVHTCTANRTDYHVLTGKPFYMRLFTGLFKPKTSFIGSDFAGEIVATGSKVTKFRKGERVMGFGGVFGVGSLAEYLVFPEDGGIVLIPGSLPYDQAAACIEGAYYAAASLLQLQFKTGQTAMVYGATGAIGSSQLQLLSGPYLHGSREESACSFLYRRILKED
ncbi:MAG: alcohol dehydrogenase catalytic domain-containing protein [Chitinophagaceae bacterium]